MTSTTESKFGVIFPVACTLIGVLATGLFAWATGHQAASVTAANACIQRVDEREKLLREKGDMFLAAMGDFVNYTQFPRTNGAEELREKAGPLIKAGFVMVAYAPPELTFVSLKISQSVMMGSQASMRKADQEAAMATIPDSFGKWPQAFMAAIHSLEAERTKCE